MELEAKILYPKSFQKFNKKFIFAKFIGEIR